MSRRLFWHNVAANITASILTLAFGLITYRFWRGKLPAIEDLV